MEAIVRKVDDRLMFINGAGKGFVYHNPVTRYAVEIPNQDVSRFFEQTDAGEQMKETIFPGDLRLHTAEEKEATPTAAKEALIERGPAADEKDFDSLLERITLIERILRV